MDNETNRPVTPTPESNKKNIYIALTSLVVVVLIAWGLSMVQPKKEVAANPCAIDLGATVYKVATSTKISDTEAARGIFEQFFSMYKTMTNCPASVLADFKLISLGKPTPRNTENMYKVDVISDIKPVDMTKTRWASSSPEAKIDGEWIRGKKSTLKIWQHDDVYQLQLI